MSTNLNADVIEALVDSGDGRTPRVEGEPAGASDSAATASPEQVTRVGHYLLLNKLGQGGMGVVHAAYDPGLDRRVALKLLHRGVTTPAWLMREGQALGRLAHPNVVGVHEVGEHDGQVFLAMEFVEGPTLEGWIHERRRPVMEVLRLFVQAGRGLAAAHAAGLVHRDFKPDNVLIGKDGRARVSDFGIAALSDALLPEETPVPPSHSGPFSNALVTPLTKVGSIVGTPAYMSPEQFRGKRATALSDQWSFCVALYQAAYHSAPFPAHRYEALVWAVLNNAPAAPPLLPDAPLWLAPILRRGLARNPSDRFTTMEELLAAIERHLPADTEHDPQIVIQEREILSKMFVVLTTAYSCAYFSEAGTRLLISPAGLIAMPAVMTAILGGVISFRWHRISKNAYGRQLAAIFFGGVLMLLIHHAVALTLGLQGLQIITEDFVLLSVFYGVVACTMDHWIGWSAAICVAAAFAAAVAPARAGLVFGATGLLSAAAMSVRLYIDRYLRPTGGASHPSAQPPVSP